MKKTVVYQVFVFFFLLLTGCTGMKYISPTDPLYLGSKINFTSEHPPKKKLLPVIQSVIKPEPNNKTLWMRPALARNNMLSDKAKTRKFWKNKVDDPVLLSNTNTLQISKAIQDRMFHNGYFENTVVVDTVFKGSRKAGYIFSIDLKKPYKIVSIGFPQPQSDLTQKIVETKDESLLKVGDIYTLDAIQGERARIDKELGEQGYIYFSQDFILLKADSVTGDHQVHVEVTVKPETPPESRRPYSIRKVIIHDDVLQIDSTTDTIHFEQYDFISDRKNLNFSALREGIFLKPGELYSRSDYLNTIRHFNDLPVIRNANIKFLQVGTSDSIDVMLYLNQRKRFAYTAEFNTLFRSTNYFGPGIIFSYTDRNAYKGAELLKINLHGSFEVQIVDGDYNPAYQMGIEVSYLLPRLYPAFLIGNARQSLPKTSISGGYNLFNRLDLYRLNSFMVNFGYRWSKTNRISHSYNPIEISFTKLPEDSKSEEFNEYLEENPGVRRSFDEQFILGMGYEFTYASGADWQNDFFFKGAVDVAGNALHVIYTATEAVQDSLGRYSLFGVPFSQYVRMRMDVRNNFKVSQRSNLAARLSAGVGIPIGNSAILPYIKQFYVGGTNSLRSFISRSVGPGSEVPPEGYNDVTGDIRLEGNLEYRFDISGNLKGALFVDAGNVWLFNEDPTRPSGNFRFDSFLEQIAISVGWGLRWDFDFIIARLDFAYTARTPYLPEGERWTEKINFLKPALSVAIGYPF